MMSNRHIDSLDASSLSAERRARELDDLAHGPVVDLLVVGLGVTGAGVALDAASRGLSVAAVDAHDLAFGTSRWSSKLVHGGLRYLASGQVGVALESAQERDVLLTRTAPHLVRPLPMVLPLTPTVSRKRSVLAWAGLLAGDALRFASGTTRDALPRPRRMSTVETARLVPALRRDGLRGGLLSWDGQLEDDARLVVALARTAAAHGARMITRCRATSLEGDGAELVDELTGRHVAVRARAVVNATGVWAGGLVDDVALRPSRGTHVVLRRESFPGGLGAAFTIPVPGESSRYVFALPQPDGLVYAGLTDEPLDGPVPDVPTAPEADIGFLLDVLGPALEVPLRRSDVVGAYAGLRPLLDASGGQGSGSSTADLSRRHAVLTSRSGVVTVVGGKLTTYRRMAEDAVDAVVAQRALDARPCRTKDLPLVGAASPETLAALPGDRRLVRRFGTEAPAVAALGDDDPSLREPVYPGSPVTRAELVWAVRREGALDVDDLLDRRTRLGLVPQDREKALPAAQEVVATATAVAAAGTSGR